MWLRSGLCTSLNAKHVSAKARWHVKHQNYYSAAFADDLIKDRKSRKHVRKALAVRLSLSDQQQPQFLVLCFLRLLSNPKHQNILPTPPNRGWNFKNLWKKWPGRSIKHSPKKYEPALNIYASPCSSLLVSLLVRVNEPHLENLPYVNVQNWFIFLVFIKNIDKRSRGPINWDKNHQIECS